MRNTFFSELRLQRPHVDDPNGLKVEAWGARPPEQDGHEVPAEEREALMLVAGAGFSYEEAAEIAGCPVGTVKSRVNRGRRKLQELLGLGDPLELARPDPLTAAIVGGGCVGLRGLTVSHPARLACQGFSEQSLGCPHPARSTCPAFRARSASRYL
jgi:predicted DNA-binding protein (UPF0251 family)